MSLLALSVFAAEVFRLWDAERNKQKGQNWAAAFPPSDMIQCGSRSVEVSISINVDLAPIRRHNGGV